jgi:hypothetical protein
MSLLPQNILPPSQPIGTVNEDGTVLIEQNWWLLLFNLCNQVLPTVSGGTSTTLLVSGFDSADGDALAADVAALQIGVTSALALAQEALLADATPASFGFADNLMMMGA